MKKILKSLMTLAAVATLAVTTQALVRADHNYGPYTNNTSSANPYNPGSAYSQEQSYHNGLAHRSNDRQSSHDQAHGLGLDNRQHNSLHQSMSHGAFHDSQDHANFDSNSGSRFNGSGYSGYGNQSFGSNYSSQPQYSASPYSVNPSYRNQFSRGRYSTQSPARNQYSTPYPMLFGSGISYSTRSYGTPLNLNHGNGSYSTSPRW
jgi:hypothetical protein